MNRQGLVDITNLPILQHYQKQSIGKIWYQKQPSKRVSGLPLTSSPAPLRRGKGKFDYDSAISTPHDIKRYNNLSNLGGLIYLIFGIILNLLWLKFYDNRHTFIVENGQNLKNNLAIWSHCVSAKLDCSSIPCAGQKFLRHKMWGTKQSKRSKLRKNGKY